MDPGRYRQKHHTHQVDTYYQVDASRRLSRPSPSAFRREIDSPARRHLQENLCSQGATCHRQPLGTTPTKADSLQRDGTFKLMSVLSRHTRIGPAMSSTWPRLFSSGSCTPLVLDDVSLEGQPN